MDFAQLKIEKCLNHQEKQVLASKGCTSDDLFAKSLILTYFKSWISAVKNNFAKQLHFFLQFTKRLQYPSSEREPEEPDVSSKGNFVGCWFDSSLPDAKCPMAQRGAINMPESRRGIQVLLIEEHRLRNWVHLQQTSERNWPTSMLAAPGNLHLLISLKEAHRSLVTFLK